MGKLRQLLVTDGRLDGAGFGINGGCGVHLGEGGAIRFHHQMIRLTDFGG